MIMGIAFRYKEHYAQWSYSGFNEFRTKLAKEAGITLSEMEGFGSRDPETPWQFVEAGTKKWSAVKDPIVPLLNHSDCDGEIGPQDCARVAPRIRELVARWDDQWRIKSAPEHQAMGYKKEFSMDNHDKVNALRLADAMEACAKDGVSLVFS